MKAHLFRLWRAFLRRQDRICKPVLPVRMPILCRVLPGLHAGLRWLRTGLPTGLPMGLITACGGLRGRGAQLGRCCHCWLLHGRRRGLGIGHGLRGAPLLHLPCMKQ